MEIVDTSNLVYVVVWKNFDKTLRCIAGVWDSYEKAVSQVENKKNDSFSIAKTADHWIFDADKSQAYIEQWKINSTIGEMMKNPMPQIYFVPTGD